MVGMSVGMQMNAQMTLGSAMQFNMLGATDKAQKMMQMAHQEMNMAVGLNGAANGFYNAARSIMGTLGAFVAESMQASYHHAVLWDPDAPPPPPPLVFLQDMMLTGRLHNPEVRPPSTMAAVSSKLHTAQTAAKVQAMRAPQAEAIR